MSTQSVCVCMATDAGSVAQSHLTREERVRDAAERETEGEVKRRREGWCQEKERGSEQQRAECQAAAAAWY